MDERNGEFDIEFSRIRLTQAKLYVIGGELIKLGNKNVTVGRHRLAAINAASMAKAFEPFNFLFGGFLVAGAVLAKAYIPFSVLSWVITAALSALAAFLVAFPFKHLIEIETEDGVMKYETPDKIEDVSGFVVSLLEMARHAKTEETEGESYAMPPDEETEESA